MDYLPEQPPESLAGPWGGPLVPVVLFDRAATVKTSRISVLFRLILAIPHIVILYLVGIADTVVMVISWFAALFTARVPQGMYGFMAWVAAYQTRFAAYFHLLTDQWPTLSETDPYPVAIRFPGPERLNRAAVLFRYILAIPASLLSGLVEVGTVIVLVPVGWVIVLIMGRVPAPLFDSFARVTRYQIRLRAYFSMLTSAYPTGLFSDKNEPPFDPPPPGPYALVPPQPNSGSSLTVGYTVLGAAGLVGYIVVIAVAVGSAVSDLDAHNALVDDYNAIGFVSPSCPSGPAGLDCLRSFEAVRAARIQAFDAQVATIGFPGRVSSEVDAVHTASRTFISDLDQLASAPSDSTFLAIRLRSEPDAIAFDNAVRALADDLD